MSTGGQPGINLLICKETSMPPKRRAARDDDDDDDDDDSESLVLHERLDDQTVLKSEGGDLVTFKAPQRCPSQ